MSEPTGWLTVPCPVCKRPPGVDCFTARGEPCATHEARKARVDVKREQLLPIPELFPEPAGHPPPIASSYLKPHE